MSTVCFYHTNCSDGAAAACGVLKKYPEAVCYPMNYGEALPDYGQPDRIFVVDFSFPVDVTERLIESTKEFNWFDHHEIDDLVGPVLGKYLDGGYGDTQVKILYFKSASGALITWNHLFGVEGTPKLVDYISDWDLWTFKLPHSRAIRHAMASETFSLENFQRLLNISKEREVELIEDLRVCGTPLQESVNGIIDAIFTTSLRMVQGNGYTFPLINCPYILASEALEQLCVDHPFAVSYYDNGKQRVYSIRSKAGSDVHVNEIAKTFGGGGHKNAAGWRTDANELLLDPVS